MPTNKQTEIDCITALASAKNEQNIAKTLNIYHPDAELIAPDFKAHATSRVEIEKNLKYFFQIFPDYHITVSEFEEVDELLHTQGIMHTTPHTVNGSTKPVTIMVNMAFKVKDGKVIKEVFDLDLGQLAEKADIKIADLLPQRKQSNTTA